MEKEKIENQFRYGLDQPNEKLKIWNFSFSEQDEKVIKQEGYGSVVEFIWEQERSPISIKEEVNNDIVLKKIELKIPKKDRNSFVIICKMSPHELYRKFDDEKQSDDFFKKIHDYLI